VGPPFPAAQDEVGVLNMEVIWNKAARPANEVVELLSTQVQGVRAVGAGGCC
jgi:hypothetical protein